MQTGLDIVAVNVAARVALVSDDTLCTITNLFDDDGDETEDVDDAMTAVIRYDDNNWFTVNLNAFSKVLNG